jgi:hypothetical protein
MDRISVIVAICASIVATAGVVYKMWHKKRETKILESKTQIEKETLNEQKEAAIQQQKNEKQSAEPKFVIDPTNGVIYDDNSKIAQVTLLNNGQDAIKLSINPILGRLQGKYLNITVKKFDNITVAIQETNISGYSFIVKYSDINKNEYEMTIDGKKINAPRIKVVKINKNPKIKPQ